MTDANGCETSTSATIALIGQASTYSSQVNAVNCFGANDGSIQITGATTGAAPDTYNWSNGATTATANNLSQGNYTVTVTNTEGCATTMTFTVNQPADAAAVVGTSTQPNGTNDGAINLTVSGGTAPYTYQWSNGATSANISELVEGSYTVTVTDANGCEIVETFSLLNTSVEDLTLVQEFQVLPNPNTGDFVIRIELAEIQDVRVQLLDVLGRHLREWNFGQEQQILIPVDISDQAGGMYLVVLRTQDGKLETRKVTVAK